MEDYLYLQENMTEPCSFAAIWSESSAKIGLKGKIEYKLSEHWSYAPNLIENHSEETERRTY